MSAVHDSPCVSLPGGLSRYIRNPGETIGVSAAVLAAITRPSALTTAGAIWALVLGELLTRAEERRLEALHGEPIRRWRRQVPRWRIRLRPIAYVPARTTAPGKHLVLYDGNCQFCTAQAKRLQRWAGDAITPRSFQGAGALDDLPGITHEACMEAMIHVAPDGRVHRGVEAIVRAVATRRPLGLAAYGYYLPGVRLAADVAYSLIAKNRYRLAAKDCPDGACALHVRSPSTRPSPGEPR